MKLKLKEGKLFFPKDNIQDVQDAPKMDSEPKEDTNQSDCEVCIGEILAYVAAIHFAHWQADTTTTEHTILGDLYSGFEDLIDKFAEVYMGKYKMIIKNLGVNIPDVKNKPIAKGEELVAKLRLNLSNDDDDLLNIAADMEELLHKSKYLLKEE